MDLANLLQKYGLLSAHPDYVRMHLIFSKLTLNAKLFILNVSVMAMVVWLNLTNSHAQIFRTAVLVLTNQIADGSTAVKRQLKIVQF